MWKVRVVEKLRTGGPGEDGLSEGDLDVGHMKLGEQPTAAAMASSREREAGMTPIQSESGPGLFPTSAKRTGSIDVHFMLMLSR